MLKYTLSFHRDNSNAVECNSPGITQPSLQIENVAILTFANTRYIKMCT